MQQVKGIIDIGNGYLKGVVIGKEEDKTNILLKTIKTTKGLRKGKILDKESFHESMQEIINEFYKKLGGDYIDEFIIGLSHPYAKVQRITEQKRVMNEKIGHEDVQHLSNIIADICQSEDEYETLKIIPIHRIIDEQRKEKDPIDIAAKKLDIVADAFLINKNFYNSLIEVLEKLEVYVTDIVPNILATVESTLDYDTRDLGAVTIDIGKSQTSFAIYEEGNPLYFGTIPLGGETVTKDISIGMQIDIREAEKYKMNYGQIHLANIPLEKNEQIDNRFLSNIITARYEEIFEKIEKKLASIDKDGRLPGGIFLSGGGSKIPYIDILAKKVFKVATFYGEDHGNISKELAKNPQFINTLGVYSRSEKYVGGKKASRNLSGGKDLFKKITSFIKKLF